MSKIDYDLTKIKAFIFDVDGVLSPTTVPIDTDGQIIRMANVRDGYAIKRALMADRIVVIISGGLSDRTILRYKMIGVEEIHMGVRDKLPCLRDIMKRHNLEPDEVAYMGDDLPDLRAMRATGLPACPFDAAYEVRQTALYISKISGGYGCARDIIEQTLRAQNRWPITDNCDNTDK